MPNCRQLIMTVMVFGMIIMANSAAFAACDEIRCYGKIQRLYMDSSGTLYIATDGDETSLNCTSPANVYVTMSSSDPNFDRQYAMLLTAFSLNQKVGLRIVVGSETCAVSYAYMDQ